MLPHNTVKYSSQVDSSTCVELVGKLGLYQYKCLSVLYRCVTMEHGHQCKIHLHLINIHEHYIYMNL